jgi:manganese transport protein
VTSQIYGSQSSTAEVVAGQQYLNDIASDLAAQGINVEMIVRYSRDPKSEIVRYAEQLRPDLIVMGAHGHKGIKDLIFGTTINAVRHNLKIPLLVVRDQDPFK